jgi:hypothetical protein
MAKVATRVPTSHPSPISALSRGHGGCLLGNVCYSHLVDVQTALMNVRFDGNNGHVRT